MHFAFLVNNMAENLSLFLRGLLIGISIAAPVGPIGILCIRRTLAEGKLKGFLSGMGRCQRRHGLRRDRGIRIDSCHRLAGG